MLSIEIPKAEDEPIVIPLSQDSNKLFVVGANGSGKSALLDHIRRQQHPLQPRTVAAHQQTHLESETVASLVSGENHRNLHVINELFESLGLGFEISIGQEANRIVARNIAADQDYSDEMLSDGERNALVLAGEVLAAPAGSVFLLDEPGAHLCREVVSLLLLGLFSQRPDCYFVIFTREAFFANNHGAVGILIVRECKFDTNGQAEHWDADLIPPDRVPQGIWDAKSKLLCVEGSKGGPDESLYSILFPGVTVEAVGSGADVIKSVRNARSIPGQRGLEVYGLIDGDDRGQLEISELRTKGVFVLPVRAVESIYCGHTVRDALARQKAEELDLSYEELASKAEKAVFTKAKDFGGLPPDKKTDLDRLIEAGDSGRIVANFPIKKCSMPVAIATALEYRNRERYERAARTLIKKDSEIRRHVIEACGEIEKVLDGPGG